jgi:GTPase SAR1 family protein
MPLDIPVITIVALGDLESGKYALLYRLFNGRYRNDSNVLGGNFEIKKVVVNGQAVGLKIFDTGQQHYRLHNPDRYRGSNIRLFCFNPSDRNSFTVLSTFAEQLRSTEEISNPRSILMCIKQDKHAHPAVTAQEITTFAQRNSIAISDITFIDLTLDYVACHEHLDALVAQMVRQTLYNFGAQDRFANASASEQQIAQFTKYYDQFTVVQPPSPEEVFEAAVNKHLFEKLSEGFSTASKNIYAALNTLPPESIVEKENVIAKVKSSLNGIASCISEIDRDALLCLINPSDAILKLKIITSDVEQIILGLNKLTIDGQAALVEVINYARELIETNQVRAKDKMMRSEGEFPDAPPGASFPSPGHA